MLICMLNQTTKKKRKEAQDAEEKAHVSETHMDPEDKETGLGSISTPQGQLAALQWSQLILTHLKMQTMSQINGQYTFNPLPVVKAPLTSASR